MRIGRPAVLFTLRAIGRDAVQVAAVGFHRSFPYLVQQRIGAGECSDGFYRRMHEQAGQALFGQGYGSRTFDFHMLETVIGE